MQRLLFARLMTTQKEVSSESYGIFLLLVIFNILVTKKLFDSILVKSANDSTVKGIANMLSDRITI